MSDYISLYPICNPKASEEAFCILPYKLKYTDEKNRSIPMELEQDDHRRDLYYIKDPDGVWMHEDYGFSIERKIVILDPSSLFGKGENAIACSNSTLGLAFQWSSKTSSRKSTKKIGSFCQADRDKELIVSEQFERAQFRDAVNFSIVLYLESSGTPQEGEELFINQPGYRLGELDSMTIQIDGNGSILPVFYEDVGGGVLWRVNCNFSVPESDCFSDSDIVSIIINRRNPNYKFIDKRNDAYNPQMANEVMAAAISMIIESFREIDPSFTTLNEAENGSVSDAIKYFREKLSWDLSTPITTNKSVREAFEQKQQ